MTGNEYDALVEMAADAHHRAKAEGVAADEISLYFPDVDQLDQFVALAKERSRWFARSDEDQTLLTQGGWGWIPATKEYSTAYEFISPFHDAPWRIEAMAVTKGTSALHNSLPEPFSPAGIRRVSVAHASFKLHSAPDYTDQRANMDGAMGPFHLRGEYENSYGRFAYYQTKVLEFFVKPRVNTRDAS